MTIRRIGWWSSAEVGPAPHPSSLVDASLDEGIRERTVAYLEGGIVAAVMMGYHRCLICSEKVAGDAKTDGAYLWPSSLAHYVGVHAVRLPEEFLTHVDEYLDRVATAPADHDWWPRAATKEAERLAREK